MRTTQYLLATLKETPSDAEIISHQLMLRAGMIRKLASGLYSWLPLGLRVLKKIENIVREEMNRAGALEMLMPSIQPSELWEETTRWDTFTPPLLKIKDRHDRDFCFGPTHEEVITDLARRELHSYKQLPLILYQIQTKFRDELRPRSGVLRSREFLMKDAYSFHADKESLEKAYQTMYEAYTKIFTRLGLNFRPVLADTGSMGGTASHEFQILAESGEDKIAISDESDYAANTEMAKALEPTGNRPAPTKPMKMVETPGKQSIEDVCAFLKISRDKAIKTLIVKGIETPLVALVLRGDHELNPLKAEKLPQVESPLMMASNDEIQKHLGCKAGYIGPVDLNIPIIVDHSAAHLADFTAGANKDDYHLQNVNWERDCPIPETADLREVVEGDLSPDGKGKLRLIRGIEAGHIFQLGSKYSKDMNASVLDENGRKTYLEMGCYGIGVSRLVGSCIEQNHDENGIIWPIAMAPFQVALVPIKMHKSLRLKEAVDNLYQTLINAGIDVLFDDRDERPGVMFADMDLIGIPNRLVLSERGLDDGTIEYKARRSKETETIKLENVVEFLQSKFSS